MKMKVFLNKKNYQFPIHQNSNLIPYTNNQHTDAAVRKIIQFNDENSISVNLKLINVEKNDLQKISVVIQDSSNYHSSSFTKSQFLLFFKLLKWPTPFIFPGFFYSLLFII